MKRTPIAKLWMMLLLCHPFFGLTQDSSEKSLDTFFCGDAAIVFHETYKELLPGISFVHVHEDETTAVEAANWLLDSVKRGNFVTWQCQQQRFVNFNIRNTQYHFDPNRIYTTAGVVATLKSNNGAYSDSAMTAVKVIADNFLKMYVNSNVLVVALHNNSNAGGLSINSYKKGAAYARDAKAVFINPKQDADDFFYTTEQAFFNFLKFKGYNVVLQHNLNVKDDGSLSVYCAHNKISYINIEAQDGHLQQQKKMLTIVWEIIKTIPAPDFFEKLQTY